MTDNGRITDLKKGGENCHHMFGISYWTKDDGYKLANDLLEQFENEETHQRFWDDVPCVLCNQDFDIQVKECTFDDIAEIDSYAELCDLDPRYSIN